MEKDSFYKPSDRVKDTNRTYVPDIYRQEMADLQAEEAMLMGGHESERIVHLQNRSLIGVLYSISAGIEGELFPVYVGRNTIGSDRSCDICLPETSVSAMHGLLLARKQLTDMGEEYISVTLSDNNSSYGTMVNGEKLFFEKRCCADGDVIAIGQNYILVLSLFNALHKLSVAYSFDRIPAPKPPVEKKEESVVEPQTLAARIDALTPEVDDHSTHVTKNVEQEASNDFYKPTKQPVSDHFNNKTIII